MRQYLRSNKDSVLPLAADMDSIFSQAGNFKVLDEIPTDKYTYIPQSTSFSGSYTLELTANVDRDAYGGLADPVSIKVELNPTTGVIILTASLKNDPAYSNLEAVLNPKGDWGKLFALNNLAVSGKNTTSAVTWTLDHISKKEAPEAAGG